MRISRLVLVLGALAATAPAPASAQTSPDGGDIPGAASGPVATTGGPALPRPVGAPAVPRHPFMAPNERSNIHNDAYQTDAYLRSGPLGRDVTVTSGEYRGICASVTFDRQGRIVTVCVGLDAITLRLLDPRTLLTLAEFPLPRRQPGTGNPFQNFTGGGYFYLDDQDRAVLPTSDRRILAVGHRDGQGFVVSREVSLADTVPSGDAIISALPDWEGRIWFASRNGVVGTIARDNTIRTLDTKEPIGNSFAIAADGVYLVTDTANYLLRPGPDGTPTPVWRTVYANDGTQKPGQSQAGSGTTPTIMGPDLVAITDNDDPIHVVVHARRDGRPICRAPVFAAGMSSDDQSLTTDGRALVAENNFGYMGPQSVIAGLSTTPGLARVDVDRPARACRVTWNSPETAPSVVPKLALGSGLQYTYTKPAGDPTDPWFLTALDWRTGETIFSVRVGWGPLLNNNYAPVTVGPDGTAYVGVLGGLLAVRDGAAPDVPPAPDAPILDPVDGASAAGTTRVSPRPRIRITCGRERTAVVRVTGPAVKRVVVRRAGRTVKGRRVPAGKPVTVIVDLRDGSRVSRRLATRRCA